MEHNLMLVLIQCLLLVTIYVLSLYVWRCQYNRNHPETIKRRFISVFVINIFSPFYLWFCIDKHHLEHHTLWDLMGIRTDGLLLACCLPLLLTVIFFIGPLISNLQSNECTMCYEKQTCCHSVNFKDIIWYRNIIVAPISEELTFRACLIPLLSQCFKPSVVVLICPVFFGAAHFNHFIELINEGLDWKYALNISCLQFLYTTVFGAYSTFLLLRSGHVIASILAHVVCNLMGVTNVMEVMLYEGFKRYALIFLHAVGVIVWGCLLFPFTEPHLYLNNVYWTNESSFVDF